MSSLDTMIPLACEAMQRAYAPYSKFPVGACLRTEGGRFYAAANVENAAYPTSTCAEAGAVAAMRMGGSGASDARSDAEMFRVASRFWISLR